MIKSIYNLNTYYMEKQKTNKFNLFSGYFLRMLNFFEEIHNRKKIDSIFFILSSKEFLWYFFCNFEITSNFSIIKPIFF